MDAVDESSEMGEGLQFLDLMINASIFSIIVHEESSVVVGVFQSDDDSI